MPGKENGPICPQLGKPCIRDRCAAWAHGIVEENGTTKAHSACTVYFWVPVYLQGIACRTDGAQRATEELRNHVDVGLAAAVIGLRQLNANIGQRALRAGREKEISG